LVRNYRFVVGMAFHVIRVAASYDVAALQNRPDPYGGLTKEV
jgi:hypothetical protein